MMSASSRRFLFFHFMSDHKPRRGESARSVKMRLSCALQYAPCEHASLMCLHAYVICVQSGVECVHRTRNTTPWLADRAALPTDRSCCAHFLPKVGSQPLSRGREPRPLSCGPLLPYWAGDRTV